MYSSVFSEDARLGTMGATRLQTARNEAPTLPLSPAKTRPDSNHHLLRKRSLMAAGVAPLLAREERQRATEELRPAHSPPVRSHLQQGWLPRGLAPRRAVLPKPLL